jgi:ADP-ribose pyrophosphatase
MANPPSADNPVLFRGTRFDVQSIALKRRSGGLMHREVVVPSNAVVVLPMLDDETVVLIRNERFAVGQTLWELPAGTLEDGENPALCAGRELLEETGYAAAEVQRLIEFYPTPGFCTELLTAYLARDLTFRGQDLDETERITTEAVPLNQSIQMVRDNRIRDAKTIATLLYYQTFLRTDAR